MAAGVYMELQEIRFKQVLPCVIQCWLGYSRVLMKFIRYQHKPYVGHADLMYIYTVKLAMLSFPKLPGDFEVGATLTVRACRINFCHCVCQTKVLAPIGKVMLWVKQDSFDQNTRSFCSSNSFLSLAGAACCRLTRRSCVRPGFRLFKPALLLHTGRVLTATTLK